MSVLKSILREGDGGIRGHIVKISEGYRKEPNFRGQPTIVCLGASLEGIAGGGMDQNGGIAGIKGPLKSRKRYFPQNTS